MDTEYARMRAFIDDLTAYAQATVPDRNSDIACYDRKILDLLDEYDLLSAPPAPKAEPRILPIRWRSPGDTDWKRMVIDLDELLETLGEKS